MARPLKYKTEKELEEKCRGYIEYLNNGKETNEVLGISVMDRITKTGLRLWLGLDKHGYSDYKKRFPNPIKKMEDIIEDTWVQSLKGNNVTGSIFYLKNVFKDDFKDRYNTDITSGELPLPLFDYVKNRNHNLHRKNSGSEEKN